MHGDDVGVAFHQEAEVLADDGLLAQIEAVKLFFLGIDGRFGRVLVLDADTLGGGVEHPSAEGHHFPAQCVYGEDDAAVETVHQLPVVALEAQSGGEQEFWLVSPCLGLAGERVLLRRTVAQLEFLDDVVAESARTEIGHADGPSVHGVVELFLEEVVGPFVDHEHALAFVLCLFFFVGELALLDFDVVFPGQIAERVGVG